MTDIRKKYIINITGIYFNANSYENDDSVLGHTKLEQFLDNEQCVTLCATCQQDDNSQIEFHNEVVPFVNRMVIFFKNRQSRLNETNVYEILQFVVLQGSPTASLYHTLHNVFTPLLLQEGKKSTAVNLNLQRQLTTFQTSLRSAAFVADGDGSNLSENNSLSVISSLEHEVEYWNSLANSAKSSDIKSSSLAFRDILKPLARDFSMLDALPLLEIEDALEGAHNVLDDLWRHDPPYRRTRMQHLMDLIASDVIHCITRQLSNINIWEDDYTDVADLLEQSINGGKKWNSACTHLTQLFWPNYSLHPWTGDSYTPQSLSDLVTRLEEVLNLRAIHRQLTRLLNRNETEDLHTSEMFKPFENLNIFQCGPYSENSWKTAVKQFEYLLLPAEQRVGEKLKVQLANFSNNTRQLLYEFTRYSQLMERPVVRKILLAERQNLLSSLGQYIKHLSGMIVNESSYSKSDTPRIITEISNVRQLESKAQVVQQTAEKLLNDLSGYEELQVQVSEFLKELKVQHSELFDSWTRELTVQINNKSLSLRESDPVVQFSSAQLMRVNYSPRLVSLVHEYRQLCAMGYRIPAHIAQTAAHAKQFMKYARSLEQVANFHNTIGDRMVSAQRPMMLAGALELSRLVQQEEVVSWGDVRSVEKYVESLRKAVNRLSRENNLLATYHLQMLEKIKELSDVDLIRHLQKWKDTAKNLRDIMNQVEQQGFTNMQSWKLEIDRALSSEFEKQYRQSLETVHLHLPEIYADLVFRDSRLQFNPSDDKLREKYQYQLKRFLDLPRSFRGVSDITEGSVFTEIIERCKDLYAQTEKHTEELFERLKGVVEHWQSWLSLGVLDTSQLATWQHWDLNFRASKTFGQEVAKLPSTEERVGCFVISLSCLRSDLESHNRSYWSQLMSSLQDSIAQDVVRLQQYVNTSTSTLTKQPLTMEQIGQAHASHSDILKQMPEMQKLFEEMVDKNKTLASWTRERVESVARLQTAWERLQSLVDNHQHLISKQVEAFQSTINRTCENLNSEIERFSLHWDQFKPRPGSGQIANDTLKNLENYLVTIKEKRAQWDELIKQKDKVLSDCEQFGMDPPEFALCDQVQTDIDQEEKVWTLFEEFNADLEKLSKEEWIVFRKRSYKLEEFVSDWQKRLETSPSTALSTRLLQELQKYEDVVPVLKYLRGEDFTEKHWMEVFTLLGISPKPVDVLTLHDFLEVSSKVSESVTELQAICKRAASEVVVRQALAELDQWEVQSRFILTEHQDSQKHTVMLIKDFKDILNKIGDNQSLLQSVKNSADYDSFSERAGLWETRLADLDHFLVSLSQIQRKWVYLEPIFGSGTLRQERGRFDRLDRDFRHVLSSIERDSRVTSLARYPNIRVILDTLQDQLSRCQNSLDNFLAEKRLKFPRFLFLGDDDLLEILGQSSREQVIQAHLKKLFSGIHSVKMSSDAKEIIAMCSLQGEVVPLTKPVNIDCPVEDWLNDLVLQMQNTLQQLLKQCLVDSQQSGPDPLQYPSQVLCLSDSITFTTRCEQAIKSATLPPLLATYKNQLKSYSLFELSNEESSGPSSESKDENILELKLKALMLDTIHHIDVVEELIDHNVTSLIDWHWQKQLRFYHTISNDSISVHMANAQMKYSFEYLGNASKLVRTPLTDKCFLTLTQGMHLGMGGNPYGPAGTGKTESVKALGSLLGRQVLVFNCDEGVDATSMGRILSGLVRSGAWGCFDEFNRLDEATLSAVSMHIQPIQVALRTGRKTLTLLDQQMEINPHCGIFVTLNPVGGGYKGRNRLPDNLKQLFRPVVMSHPDHEQITRTLLRCDGYQSADLIGKKLVEVFSMANELLSKQQHYDWGLRALKTVLGGCGSALNRLRRTKDYMINSNITNAEDDIRKQEMQLVVEALRVNTLSKLTYADSERFDSLVSDIFVGVPFQNTGHEKLVAALEESCSELGFQVNDRQISKCVELYEQLQQRMGVTIVGPSGSGKSTLRKLLLRALNKMSNSVTQHVFNPKAMTRAQLLGQIDLDTRQWTDGVLTLYALQVYAEPNEVWSWVVCDGDIDPEWVESLNSVLDDNRLLTLPSGWRIQFGPNVNFLFETHDLSYASPATVSRMGIVFLSEEDVKLGDIVNNWLSWQPEDTLRISTHLLNDYFFKAIDWIKTEGDLVIPCSNVSIVQTGLSQLRKLSSKTQFTVALIAGLGGLLTQQTRESFAQKVFEWTGEHCPDEKSILRCSYNANRDVIDIYYSDSNYQILETNLNDLPLVLTGQVLQTLDILKPWLSVGSEEHFLLVGPHGSAKSLIINHLVREQHNMDIATIYCSNNIMPQYVLHKLTQHCMVVSSNRGRVYRPKKGRLVLYFKGLHLLKPDKWGTNILLAFLHQLITYGGLFDSNLEWVGLESVTIVGSLSSTDTISTRFTSVMKIHNVDLPEREDLNIIYESYMTALIKSSLSSNSVWAIKSKTAKLVFTLIAIYEEIKNTFTVMQQRHYIFSPHDLTNWCTNLMRYKPILSSNPSDSENTMLEILVYEAFRIFNDKLVNDDDRGKFQSIVAKTFQLQWGKSTLLSNLKGIYYVPSEQYNNNKSQEILSLTRLNSDDWTSLVKKGILHFGREGQTLDLLIISELLLLTSSIARALSQKGGCVLLAGRSGVGRHSSVRVVSALQSAKLITPISGTVAQFKNDLKSAMQMAGVEGDQVYFVLEDHMMRKAVIVDMINTLLAAGEIPGLHTAAELDSLSAGLKDEADRENFEGNHVQYFVQRVRSNLHLVICLEVDSSEFWRILENCPILYQRCTVIWQSEWSSDSMTKMPNLLLQKLSENGLDDGIITEMPTGFYDIHKQAKTSLSTPRRYISLINSYLNLFTEKKKVILQRQTKLQAGITKLTEAQDVVADLKVKALDQQKILAEKQAKANSALDMISATMKNANVHKQEMETLKEQTEKENELIIKRKKAIELELAEVEPILQEARAAVGNIRPEALSEIRSLRAPPDIIRDILEGVLRLMGTQDTSWNSMKTFLAKRGVREDIRSFDASKINPDSRQAVERLIATRSDSFDPKAARRASIAAAPLASWVMANVKFSQVVEKIRPLEREQYKLQQNLKNAEQQIGELSAGLSDVDAKVAQLKVQLSTYTKEAAEIEINLKVAEDKLHAAEGLVNKLNEEYGRWKTQLKELSDDLNDLPIKCILAAAYISYLSGEFESERKSQIADWCNILVGDKYDFSFEEFLSTEREQLQWQTEGLLSDMLSIHNAIVILKTNINVLLLDPSSLALQWLRTHFKHRTVEIVTQNAPRFTNSLELAVRFGKVLIIEEVDNIPPVLFPILRKEFVYQGTRRLVLLGNKLVDYHNDFSLYLSSRNLFVNIPPDASAVLSIVNFTTTNAGLTEQLLSGAIRQEYPQLEAKRNELLQKQEELQEQQYNLQNQLLEELANATGDILQNKQLLASLNETKASSVAISTALKESTKIQAQLKAECDVLRPLSSFGSLLYFATTDLVRLNVMYSISISSFIKLFLKAISTTNNAQEDYSQVQKVLLQSVYSYVSRGMFKSDRLLFALYLCKHMFPDKISNEEWNLFLGHTKSSKTDSSANSDGPPNWISEQFSRNVVNLQNTLPNLYNSLKLEDYNSWEKFMKSRECEKYFPNFCNLTDFQQVLIVQMLRPDRLYTVMNKCVLHLTGMKNLSPRVIYLSQLFKETVPSDPVLLITAPGADPSSELRDLATALIGIDKYKEVAMGEGQESLALQSLEDSAKLGHWLCLKNLHLVTAWSSLLSQKIQTLNHHENFRLWLVTESHPLFSSVLIQSCTKLAYEAPPGIKNNLLRSYATWGKNYIQKQNATGARLLFILAYVHALLQERRTYIPQGWTKWYEFSDVDLYTAANLSEEIWGSKNGSTLWNHIRGLCSDAVYGGRIDERQDERVLLAYLRQNFVDIVLGHKWKLTGMSNPFPNNSNYQDYIDCINQLSDDDNLTYFGLPANIDRAWEINSSMKLISNLKVIRLPVKNSTKIERDDWNRGLSPLLVFWKKLNKGQEWLRISIPKASNADNPVATYMAEEKRFSIELIQNIHRSLISISKITRGASLPTDKDIDVVNSLLAYQTPYEWISFWKGPTEPFKYLQTVIDKASAISKWNIGNDSQEILLNSTINLSTMFRPKVFLSALKQHTSRLTKVAANDLHLVNSWQEPLQSTGNVTLIGIFIEGALFDGQKLIQCSSDSENVTSAPACSIAWVPKKSFDRNENNLEVPLYSSSRREEHLTTMILPADKTTHDKWLLTGTSLFLEY